ncbi:hypothetical protein [Halomonas stenophila]|uniref:Uncharacterized protein n=1 Tax=Halomonas stenophila TaxID=795312 RepID=A0A7W5HMJ0_9GAMM|nr:hypothetical protein [Halomonas stenophila]MBB3232901.1 hypothetical protein [Halomonas stenophila]
MNRTLFFVAIATTLMTSGLWFWLFEDTPPGELTTKEVVPFATYFGGIMTPIIAFLSLMAFLRTLGQQQELMAQQEEHLKQQQSQLVALENGAKKADLFQVIDRLDQDFEKLTKDKVIRLSRLQGADVATVYDLLNEVGETNWKGAIPDRSKFGEFGDRIMGSFEESKPDVLEPLSIWRVAYVAASMLIQLRLYLDEHDRIAGSTALTEYYISKYQVAYYHLADKHYLEVEDMPDAIQNGPHLQ